MAGILLHTRDDNRTHYFLFARERINNNPACSDRGLWSDFGGSRDKGETLKNCAIREGCEELCGFLSKSLIRERAYSENDPLKHTPLSLFTWIMTSIGLYRII